jgi:hypothetical protein
MNLHDRVNRRLKLRDLRLLLAVAESRSMAKAATRINLTQSAVSRAIGELEHTLGVRLFDRTAQGVEPTIYGRALLKGGVAIFGDLRTSVSEIEFLSDPTAGELRPSLWKKENCKRYVRFWPIPLIKSTMSRTIPQFAL